MAQVRSSEPAGETTEKHLSADIPPKPSDDPSITFVDGNKKSNVAFTGPTKKRSCTDICCGILFFLFILLLAAVTGWSYLMGDYRRIIFPKDSQGKICGLDYPDKKYLVFFDMLPCLDLKDVVMQYGCPTPQVCVSQCPKYTWSPSEGDVAESRSKMICQGGVSGLHEPYNTTSIDKLIEDKLCAPNVSPSKKIFMRCVPKKMFEAVDRRSRQAMRNPEQATQNPSFSSIVFGARTMVTQILEDLIRTWKVIVVCILLAALASFLWIFLMRLCSSIMVYFTLLLFVCVFGVATGFCFWQYVKVRKIPVDPPPFYFTIDITFYFRYANTWLAFGIISALILLLVLCVLIFLRKRISLASRVIGETSKAIAELPVTLVWPIFPFLLILGVIVLCLFIDLNLRSIAVSEGVSFANASAAPRDRFSHDWMQWALKNAIKCDPNTNTTAGEICRFVKHTGLAYIPWLQVYTFIMCLWLINFFIAMDQLTLAGVFATFYFAGRRSRQQETRSGQSSCCNCGRLSCCGCCGASLLLSSLTIALSYHLGSLALGSLLITLFSVVQAILVRIERKLKMSQNPVAAALMRCMCCCFWCLEKFLRFLSKNAYIMMAIYGKGFCVSAKNAFGLITRNAIRVFVVEAITDFILIVGKLTVCAFATFASYAYLSGAVVDYLSIDHENGLGLNYVAIPVLVVSLGSYLVAKAFFTVYEMGIDTIFLCVCEDLERNDGTPEKPFLMSKSMMETLKKPEGPTANQP